MEPPSESLDPAPPAPGLGRRALRASVRALALALAFVGLYLAAAEAAMRIPVHASADPDGGEVDVYLVTNGVHVSVWLPTTRPERDWSRWLPPEVPARPGGYVAFGWGDHDFYLEVPTWDDLTAGVALRGAFWPTRSAMRATAYTGPPIAGEHVHRVSLNPERYRSLVEFVERGFERNGSGEPILLAAPGYGATDRFFEGRGRYHLFQTCNTWANGAVKAMGQRAALWTPFERGARHHLPRNQGVGRPR
jgi:uncharacterized protein (TIGR02117 family)